MAKKSAEELEMELWEEYRKSLIEGYMDATPEDQDGMFMYLMSHGIKPSEIGVELPPENLMPNGELNLLSLIKKDEDNG